MNGQQDDSHEGEGIRGARSRPPLARLLARYPERPVRAALVLVNSFVAIALLAGLAMVTATPFVFPSLGPTAFLFFFTPTAPSASPRSTILGHAIGLLCGYGALLLVGLEHAPAAIVTGVDGARILAASLSLACTGGFMILLGVAHPPAGATTLIISLGIVTRPSHLLILEAAVVVLTLYAIAVNRLLGADAPGTSPPRPTSS